ncbi:MAG: TonB-dependent receptor, partial [Thermoanaerobaculia bacterium]|nr:TonB-dependent receptor [Thermoanaerobaculia bacterium]
MFRCTSSPAFLIAFLTLLLSGPPPGHGGIQEPPSSPSDPPPEEAGEEEDRHDHDERLQVYEEVEVIERVDDLVGIAATSSEGTTGREALLARPIQRAGELVETVPGLIATQHSGDGKANQYFLRGFNLDHGTDFAITVAGIPVNMPTHGHGHGYADVNFLIPEAIDSVRFRKGTADVEAGDFAAAGSARFELRPRLERGFAEVTLGSFSYGRAVAGNSWQTGPGDLTAMVEAHGNDGPWVRPNDYERVNGLLHYNVGDAAGGWSLTAMGYEGDWLSTDQIPERAVADGRIDRFGLVDPGPRGNTGRYSLSGEWRRGDAVSLTRLIAYGLAYDFQLFGNFTYFLDDPELGDQVEQLDDRWAGGVDLSHRRHIDVGSQHLEWAVGLQARYDDIDTALYRTSDLERTSVVREDQTEQWGLGPWAEVAVPWTPWLRSTVGLRLDTRHASVRSNLAANSGSADDTQLSPKVALAFGPWQQTELYLSGGRGFHSSDARGATITVDPSTGEPASPEDLIVEARGYEVGVRTSILRGLQSTFTIFSLELDSELIFVGDAGVTEAGRPSQRLGIEWTNAWQAKPWLLLDLDLALVDAEFSDDDPAGKEIPGALEHVISAGATLERGPWFGAFRLRYFDGYPLIEDGSVRAGSTAVLN